MVRIRIRIFLEKAVERKETLQRQSCLFFLVKRQPFPTALLQCSPSIHASFKLLSNAQTRPRPEKNIVAITLKYASGVDNEASGSLSMATFFILQIVTKARTSDQEITHLTGNYKLSCKHWDTNAHPAKCDNLIIRHLPTTKSAFDALHNLAVKALYACLCRNISLAHIKCQIRQSNFRHP